jgi:23S rRNA maturation-related 3'-5' exoribonuclease YhaM
LCYWIVFKYFYFTKKKVEITKFNKEKLKLALQITGIKISHSVALAEEVFGMVFEGT